MVRAHGMDGQDKGLGGTADDALAIDSSRLKNLAWWGLMQPGLICLHPVRPALALGMREPLIAIRPYPFLLLRIRRCLGG